MHTLLRPCNRIEGRINTAHNGMNHNGTVESLLGCSGPLDARRLAAVSHTTLNIISSPAHPNLRLAGLDISVLKMINTTLVCTLGRMTQRCVQRTRGRILHLASLLPSALVTGAWGGVSGILDVASLEIPRVVPMRSKRLNCLLLIPPRLRLNETHNASLSGLPTASPSARTPTSIEASAEGLNQMCLLLRP